MNETANTAAMPDSAEESEGKRLRLSIDKAIKYLFSAEKQALIKLVNSALGESHDPEMAVLSMLNTEFVSDNFDIEESEHETESFDLDMIIADMIFTLDGVAYHIEFQTTADKTIVIRIMGYGVGHALNSLKAGGSHEEAVLELPVPVLIQIDKDDSIPDKIPASIRLSGREDSYSFEINVIKLWNHDAKSLVSHGFHLLLPFLLVKHRKGKNSAADEKAFLDEYVEVKKAITELYESKEIRSDLMVNLYTILAGIVKHINATRFDDSERIEKEMAEMNTTRPLYSQEIRAISKAEGEAEGEARGKAIGAQTVILFMQKNAPAVIAEKLGIPLKEVEDLLREFGLMETQASGTTA